MPAASETAPTTALMSDVSEASTSADPTLTTAVSSRKAAVRTAMELRAPAPAPLMPTPAVPPPSAAEPAATMASMLPPEVAVTVSAPSASIELPRT